MRAKLLVAVLGLVAIVGARPAHAEDEKADLRGAVKEVKNGYILVSVGGKQGLKVGDTLAVYRTDPRPAYVGRLRLLVVKEAEAVGRLETKSNEIVQIKDHVARRLPTK